LVNIRLAVPADAAAILKIYAPYISNTSCTFELEIPTLKEFEKRIETYLLTWPWLICEIDGSLAGYAYASQYRERRGYQWCTECSVYIHDDFQNRGVANALYDALMQILKMQGFVNVYAVINLPNPKSVRFHEKAGFTWLATYDHVGFKLGRWKDVGWWQLRINDFADEPGPPKEFSKMDTDLLPAVFEKALKKIKSV